RCLDGAIATRQDTGTFDCAVTESVPNGRGGTTSINVPPCDAAGLPPANADVCWQLVTDATLCPSSHRIVINHVNAAPSNTNATITCALCSPGAQNSGC